MNDDTLRKCRTAMKIIPAVISSIVLILVIVAMLMPNYIIAISDVKPMSLSMDGSELILEGTYEIRSDLPYAVDDLSISMMMTDADADSQILLWKEDGIHISPGASETIVIHSRFFSPILVLFVKELLSRADPDVNVIVSASCSYMMRMVDVKVDAHLESPLSQPGSTITYATDHASPSELSLDIDGLADHLIPDESSITISNDHDWIWMGVTSSKGHVSINIESGGDLNTALDSLKDSDSLTRTDDSGGCTVMDPANSAIILNAISLILKLP